MKINENAVQFNGSANYRKEPEPNMDPLEYDDPAIIEVNQKIELGFDFLENAPKEIEISAEEAQAINEDIAEDIEAAIDQKAELSDFAYIEEGDGVDNNGGKIITEYGMTFEVSVPVTISDPYNKPTGQVTKIDGNKIINALYAVPVIGKFIDISNVDIIIKPIKEID